MKGDTTHKQATGYCSECDWSVVKVKIDGSSRAIEKAREYASRHAIKHGHKVTVAIYSRVTWDGR